MPRVDKPPPSYETVTADSNIKNEPEALLPSYREVAANPAEFNPSGTYV